MASILRDITNQSASSEDLSPKLRIRKSKRKPNGTPIQFSPSPSLRTSENELDQSSILSNQNLFKLSKRIRREEPSLNFQGSLSSISIMDSSNEPFQLPFMKKSRSKQNEVSGLIFQESPTLSGMGLSQYTPDSQSVQPPQEISSTGSMEQSKNSPVYPGINGIFRKTRSVRKNKTISPISFSLSESSVAAANTINSSGGPSDESFQLPFMKKSRSKQKEVSGIIFQASPTRSVMGLTQNTPDSRSVQPPQEISSTGSMEQSKNSPAYPDVNGIFRKTRSRQKNKTMSPVSFSHSQSPVARTSTINSSGGPTVRIERKNRLETTPIEYISSTANSSSPGAKSSDSENSSIYEESPISSDGDATTESHNLSHGPSVLSNVSKSMENSPSSLSHSLASHSETHLLRMSTQTATPIPADEFLANLQIPSVRKKTTTLSVRLSQSMVTTPSTINSSCGAMDPLHLLNNRKAPRQSAHFSYQESDGDMTRSDCNVEKTRRSSSHNLTKECAVAHGSPVSCSSFGPTVRIERKNRLETTPIEYISSIANSSSPGAKSSDSENSSNHEESPTLSDDEATTESHNLSHGTSVLSNVSKSMENSPSSLSHSQASHSETHLLRMSTGIVEPVPADEFFASVIGNVEKGGIPTSAETSVLSPPVDESDPSGLSEALDEEVEELIREAKERYYNSRHWVPPSKNRSLSTQPGPSVQKKNLIRYPRPKLFKPARWANKNLYNYLGKTLEKKHKLRHVLRAEEIVKLMHVTHETVVGSKIHEKKAIDELKHELAVEGIIETTDDFHVFIRTFLPPDFSDKVIPALRPFTNIVWPPKDGRKYSARVLDV